MESVWSLCGGEKKDYLDSQTKKLEKMHFELEKKNYIKRNLNLVFYIFIVLIIIFCLVDFLSFFVGAYSFPFFSIFAIVIGFICYFGLRGYYNSFIRDFVKYEVAKEFGWSYEPDPNKNKWYKLREDIPEIFKKGNTMQEIDDQYYGQIYFNRKAFDFHSGIFHYAVRTSNGKSSSTTHYYRHFFAFRLNKRINSRFFLYPENIGSKVGNWFNGKEVNVESNEFNKKFAFSYSGKKIENEIEIVKIISPSMQLKLLDLYNKKGAFNVLFSEDFVIFDFCGRLKNRFKTDFAKSIQVNREDVEDIKNEFKNLVGIMQEIAGKLH
jgi:hypothetical protein